MHMFSSRGFFCTWSRQHSQQQRDVCSPTLFHLVIGHMLFWDSFKGIFSPSSPRALIIHITRLYEVNFICRTPENKVTVFGEFIVSRNHRELSKQGCKHLCRSNWAFTLQLSKYEQNNSANFWLIASKSTFSRSNGPSWWTISMPITRLQAQPPGNKLGVTFCAESSLWCLMGA